MKKPYWNESPLASELTALIERCPSLYGCSVAYLESVIATRKLLDKIKQPA